MTEHKIFEGMKSTYEQSIAATHPTVFGELDYLMSTPQIVEIIIRAASDMLDTSVPEQYITIGTHLDLRHEQPTLIIEPGNFRVELLVTKLEDNKIWLDVQCFDKIGRVCSAIYERTIVDKERFRFATYERAGRHKL